MHDVWLALITVGGSVLTGLIVAVVTLKAAHGAREDQRRRDLDAALSEFLAAVTKAFGRMANLPHMDPAHPMHRLSRWRSGIGERLFGPAHGWANQQIGLRRTLGDEPMLPAERVVDAASRLRILDLGSDLTKAIDETLDYLVDLGDDRSETQLARWPAIRTRLLDAIRVARAEAA